MTHWPSISETNFNPVSASTPLPSFASTKNLDGFGQELEYFAIILISLLWLSVSIGLFVNDQLWFIKSILNFCILTDYSIASSGINENSYLIPSNSNIIYSN